VVRFPICPGLDDGGAKRMCCSPRQIDEKTGKPKLELVILLVIPKLRLVIKCGDTVITSVHVLFDESIPERSADYFRELDEATVKVWIQTRDESRILTG
jgi:hypothetical protein